MEIPYGKLTVYLITFIGYIYSGYGTNLLNNIREAILSAESIFGDTLKNVVGVANNVKSVSDLFNAAVEEHCIFTCPNQDVTPKPNRNHKASANGCGPIGLKIDTKYLPVVEMTKCCDAHDVCYDTCNKLKDVCDSEFKSCLYKYCEVNKNKLGENLATACKAGAKVLYTGTTALGCKSFIDAQRNACYCGPSKESKKNYKYTKGDEL